MQLAGQYPPLIFTTDSETGLLAVHPGGIRVIPGGVDRTRDLAQRKTVAIFPSDCSAAQVDLRLDLKKAPPSAPVSLLFQLDTPGGIPAQYSPNAADNVPPPATVTWMYRDAHEKWKALPNVNDGTGGFRRSGIVSFAPPADWAAGADGYALSASVEQASFASPVALNAPVIANVAMAHHRDPISATGILKNRLPLPGQTLPISGQPIEDTVRLQILDRDGIWQSWTAVQDFGPFGPGDRVFIVDRAAGMLRFGDGLTGRIPRPDANQQVQYRLQYDSGGGAAGNVGSGLCWSAADSSLDCKARNIVPGAGGVEAETLQAAQDRVREELNQVTRAVIPQDYEQIVQETPGAGIARAHASIGKNPAIPGAVAPGSVTVYAVPYSTDTAPQPDPGALEAARARLESARLIGTETFVEGPRYREISLLVNLQGTPTNPPASRDNVASALQAFLNPLTGGDAGKGWPFGDAISPSALLRQAQAAAGEGIEVLSVAIGIDGAPPTETCLDVAIGPDDLVTLTSVTVELSAGPAFSGGLQ
jgi:hypothetical protein